MLKAPKPTCWREDRRPFSRFRPVMLVEGPRELWASLQSFFTKNDYVLLDGAAENPVPLQNPVWDTVAVPREKLVRA